MRDLYQQTKAVLFGVAIGDALGVPVEFQPRESLRRNPVTDMRGYGTHNMPPGTFSDDASLTFCLAEALTGPFDFHAVARHFIAWYQEGYWTATGKVFDVGNATAAAIRRIINGTPPHEAGGAEEESNGNGSLMRIAPLLFHVAPLPLEERFRRVQEVSSITHRHIRSVVACFYYLEFARLLQQGVAPMEAYKELQGKISAFLTQLGLRKAEIRLFDRILNSNLADVAEDDISSSGYVLHTLEAAVFCLLTTSSFEEAVLKAVNLGEDTDTTGAVTGALAGIVYGYDAIPGRWIQTLPRSKDIEELAGKSAGFLRNAQPSNVQGDNEFSSP